ncbi:hypothetical protein JXA12_01695 [Candidatus Woesearchaeota archaeon]|nr:hypothetical protein [Candidatus Woesearchaeota archaeon]
MVVLQFFGEWFVVVERFPVVLLGGVRLFLSVSGRFPDEVWQPCLLSWKTGKSY